MSNTIPQNAPQKQCSTCEKFFPETREFFRPAKECKNGLSNQCRICHRAYDKERRNHPEVRARNKVSRQTYESRPEIRERRKAYYEPWRKSYINSPEYQEYQRTYANNPDVQEHKKAYRDSEHSKLLHRAASHRRRSLQRSNGGTHTSADIQAQHKRQKNKCYYCRKKLTKYHVDHIIPLARGGSNGPENLVIACPTCNHSKGDKLLSEWPEGGRLL